MRYFKRKPYAEMMRAGFPGVDDVAPTDSLSSTSSSVEKAAAVLRDELAALPEMPGTRSADHASLTLGRGTREAPALVDALSSVVGAQAKPTVMGGRTSARTNATIPLLEPPAGVPAGGVATVLLSLENDEVSEPVACRLAVGELLGSSGHRLPASCISVSPAVVQIPPRGAAEVRVAVNVPPGAAPGVYSGVLQTDESEPVRVILQVCVSA